MQFSVPQFTDVEDKLIGPLTLKQFLILFATGLVVLFFYSFLKLTIFFFFFSAPVALLGLALAFGKFNGRPLYSYVGVFVNYVSRPQIRVFRREEPVVTMSIKPKELEKINEPSETNLSQLKKVAYLLDQKTEEEKQLLNKT